MSEDDNRLIEVCADCLTASCWHGELMCETAYEADTVKKTREYLKNHSHEHPSNYSDKKLNRMGINNR